MGFYQNVDIYGYLLGLALDQEFAFTMEVNFVP